MLINFFLTTSVRKCKEKTLFSFKACIFAPFPFPHSRLFLHLRRGVPKVEFKINIINTTKMLTLRTAYSSL